jgi:hypothetical protein
MLRGGVQIRDNVSGDVTVPRVTISATFDGQDETMSEYICDFKDCPNIAVEVLGIVPELRVSAAVCAEHAAEIAKQKNAKS